MPYHPEARPGETFVGNLCGESYDISRWPTARFADKAYDIYGVLLPAESYKALIIGDADLAAYNAHMDAEFRKIKYGRPR